jgi:peptidoglycan/xylan/chitin deacetylase (PgdA/CDA1 family)
MGLPRRIFEAALRRLPAQGVDRAVEFLLPRRPFERLQVPQRSALTVVCDDGESRDLEIVEVLQRQGVKGVFAVSPDLIGRPGFLSYAELRQIRAAGHEIAFHGTTHDPFNGFAGPAELQAATERGLQSMAAEGLGTPRTLIYPYGRHNRWVRAASSRHFACAFTTWFGLNRARANRYAIRRIPFGAYVGKLPGTEAWYRGFIDQAAAAPCWPTLMLHPAAAEHQRAHTDLLARLVEYSQARGVPVRTVAAHLDAAAPAPAAVPNSAQAAR